MGDRKPGEGANTIYVRVKVFYKQQAGRKNALG
jgi:hypothetical protein